MKEKTFFNNKAARFADSIAEIMEMPESAILDVPTMEMCSNTEIAIDGCKGVLEYSTEKIRIATGKMTVQIVGMELQLKCMTIGSVIITGIISEIAFFSDRGV